MLSNGNSKGLTASIPVGGHVVPISVLGAKAVWKNVQKIAKKKKASLTINKPTPKFKPLSTAKVWSPKYVASVIISLNQRDIELTKINKDKYKKLWEKEKLCAIKTNEVVKDSKAIHVRIGQGDGDTKWKGWGWKLLLVKFVTLKKKLG